MKRRELVKLLQQNGWRRHPSSKGKHDKFVHSSYSRPVVVPRHTEIPEGTARAILKQAGIR